MSYVVIPRGDGYISHANVDLDSLSPSDDAEIYDDRDEFEDRLADFDNF